VVVAWSTIGTAIVALMVEAVSPTKNTRYRSLPLTVMWLLPPSITVPLPVMSGSSLPSVIVELAIELSNVTVVPGCALA